jgi:hypothetical protein
MEEPTPGTWASREECITKRLNDLGLTPGSYTFDSDKAQHVLLVKVSPQDQLEWREEYRQPGPQISDSNSDFSSKPKDEVEAVVHTAKRQENSRQSAYPYHSHKSRSSNPPSSSKPKSNNQPIKAEEKGKAPRKYYRPKDSKSGSNAHNKEKKASKDEKEANKSSSSRHHRHQHHHRRCSSSSSSE